MSTINDRTRHVIPVNDLVEHESSSACICGPITKPVINPGVPDGWLFIHPSLDGREKDE